MNQGKTATEPAEGEVALLVRDLRVVFAQAAASRSAPTVAVDDVSLEVHAGEVLGILGASGSGKSTLLRAIAGLETLAGGTVAWHGTDITRRAVHERGFALMFQDGQLFLHRSVADNIAYPLRIARVAREARHARVTELLDLVGLPGTGERRVTDLSGGEQQRVALARALAARPRLLLLDEPLSSLDRELRDRLTGDLRRILTTTGTTAIMVTHDQDEAFALSDRVGIMGAGRLLQIGAPADVWRNPATADIARFLGYTSVLDNYAARIVDPSSTTPIALRPGALVVADSGIVGTVLSSTTAVAGVRLRLHIEGVGEVTATGRDDRMLPTGTTVTVRVDFAGVARLARA
ncbi:ABC transporter ATP-binding protein [Glaciihabitans sp. dw_435]|uniref:ABC transporter ATP-binding protein n=1 Tax=Glaciihabitans sp. dw_435 TaxID=2720081 RepID=UPI0027DDDCD2|nr:ABC transporter ATP-binding protein [Glaciihabitans sp. dw_435]